MEAQDVHAVPDLLRLIRFSAPDPKQLFQLQYAGWNGSDYDDSYWHDYDETKHAEMIKEGMTSQAVARREQAARVNAANGFIKLPKEVQHMIFKELSWCGLFKLRGTSKTLRILIDTYVRHLCRQQLGRQGVEAFFTSNIADVQDWDAWDDVGYIEDGLPELRVGVWDHWKKRWRDGAVVLTCSGETLWRVWQELPAGKARQQRQTHGAKSYLSGYQFAYFSNRRGKWIREDDPETEESLEAESEDADAENDEDDEDNDSDAPEFRDDKSDTKKKSHRASLALDNDTDEYDANAKTAAVNEPDSDVESETEAEI